MCAYVCVCMCIGVCVFICVYLCVCGYCRSHAPKEETICISNCKNKRRVDQKATQWQNVHVWFVQEALHI
jgi:hypothetical protein